MNEPAAGAGPDRAPSSILDAQVDALTQRVTKDRERRCTQLRTGAAGQARAIVRAARTAARGTVHEAIERERKQGELALRHMQAAAVLQQWRQDQEQWRALLKEMWASMTGVLELRWADPARRLAWVRAAGAAARAVLSDRSWRIAHGAGWAPQELDALQTLARDATAGEAACSVTLTLEPAIRAGIRISTQHACLDATAAGLLSARTQVEADFLAQYLALGRTKPQAAHE